MKKITLLISLLLISVVIYAQKNNLVDVVYLKNGSILRGIIIEQVPNESIKLQTADGNIFVYQTSEIEKITKEGTVKQSRNQFAMVIMSCNIEKVILVCLLDLHLQLVI